jgi:hypothetical protein
MKNEIKIVNLYMEKGEINSLLSRLYSEKKDGFTNENLVSMIKGLCIMDNLDYRKVIDVNKIKMPVPIIPKKSWEDERMLQNRKYLRGLATMVYYSHNLNSIARRKTIENEMLNVCDRSGLNIKDFLDFETLPPVLPQLTRAEERRVYTAEKPEHVMLEMMIDPFEEKEPISGLENKEIGLPEFVHTEEKVILNSIQSKPITVLASTNKKVQSRQPIGKVCPVEDCHNVCDGTEKNRFKMLPIQQEMGCNRCYMKQLRKQKTQITDQ